MGCKCVYNYKNEYYILDEFLNLYEEKNAKQE